MVVPYIRLCGIGNPVARVHPELSGKPDVTSRPSWFDNIDSSASSSLTTAASRHRHRLQHVLAHDHSTVPHAHPAARLSRHHWLPDFDYIDHNYFTHGFIDHGSLMSFALVMSSMAQRVIIRIEHSRLSSLV
uniref:Uncharacterized protein n=1 Tax=Oryza rufipogon TaxID=4529 RepID=A0A0E0NUE4_ORYRU